MADSEKPARIEKNLPEITIVKFMFSKKATKIDEIFTVDLMLCSKRQIDGEDFCQFLWPS